MAATRHPPATAHFTCCFPNFRASVRRCMPSRRAVSEMLKPVSASVSWMRSHSKVLLEVERFVSPTAALPAARPNAASMSSVFDGFAREWQAPSLIASTAVAMLAKPVSTTINIDGACACSACSQARPEASPASLRSTTAKPGEFAGSSATTSAWLLAVMRRQPWMRRFDFDTEAVVRLAWRGIKPINLAAPVKYLTAEEGGVSHFKYGRDNVLLTWMHARLMLEFALRLPMLLWCRVRGKAPFQRL